MTREDQIMGGVRIGLWAAAVLAAAGAAQAQDIAIPDNRAFPESLTSTRAGDVIIGSMGKGGVYRARRGETTASLWIDPQVSGVTSMAGVFADDKTDTLYACSLGAGAPPDQAALNSAVRAFDLNTGAAKASYPMPYGARSFCNDFAVDKAGNLYVTDTIGGAIHRLAKGAAALQEWIKDPRLAGADGIAIGGDGNVYVNTVFSGKLFRVPVNKDGSAGTLTELTPSMTMSQPDGLRALGGLRFLQAEGGTGRVEVVVVSGDNAALAPIKEDDPGVTAVTVARGKVFALNGKLNYMRNKALQGQDPGPVKAEAVELPK